MNGMQLFQDAGWKVLYKRNTVTVIDSNQREYLVCDKYFGGGDYDEELKIAYKKAVDRGLIVPHARKEHDKSGRCITVRGK